MSYGSGYGPGYGPGYKRASPPVSIPNVVGDTEAAAISALETAGFVVVVQRRYSNSVAVGNVMSQVPAAGQSAQPGSTVYIRVSRGPAPANTGYGFIGAVGNLGFIQ